MIECAQRCPLLWRTLFFDLFFVILLLLLKEVINIRMTIIVFVSLWLIAYGMNKNENKYNIIAFCVLLFFSILLFIQGFNDYIKYFSSIIAIILFIYFTILFVIKKCINKIR